MQGISAYADPTTKIVPDCPEHGPMEREIVIPNGEASSNPLAGDRHYDGLRASDGSDISTRTKHREYMKANGLTTVDDFKNTWAKAEEQRKAFRTGNYNDPNLRRTIERELYKRSGG